MSRETVAASGAPRTLLEKVWRTHVVSARPGAPDLLYIDLHLLHEVTSPQAFESLRSRGVTVRRPDRTLGVADHAVPTLASEFPIRNRLVRAQLAALDRNCAESGIPLLGVGHHLQGIVHVIAPELGLSRPGMTIVCGDSHTSTHGALGALAFGIGTSEVEQVLASQCLLQHKPRAMEVCLEGGLGPAVTSKDVALELIATIGESGGTGHVIEFSGPAVSSLPVEARMSLCNMCIEAGARSGMFAPDELTVNYLKKTPMGADLDDFAADAILAEYGAEEGALYEKSITLDLSQIEPMVTYGTAPGMSIPVTGTVPDPAAMPSGSDRQALLAALDYMQLTPGAPVAGTPVDVVFFGSCTNGRLTDLEQATEVLRGRKVAPHVQAIAVPGSQSVKRAAEQNGIAQALQQAGVEWREPGCSLCVGINGDTLRPGQYCVSTSNRNFKGRQGKGGRTILASPFTAAAAAVQGQVADPRPLLRDGGGRVGP